ncbi:DUF7003 family protein [Rhodovulum sp. DZ06]|uniref:DUF7003 family protein n=1 Tax=Rhodovulum sp. DZ06 TaxID=3425126 RepID=UPI003D33493C
MKFTHTAQDILDLLDREFSAYRVNIIGNGYVFPAKSRLSLYRSAADWAMVVEQLGFMAREPREDGAGVTMQTVGPVLRGRRTAGDFVSEEAWRRYCEEMAGQTEEHDVWPLDVTDWAVPDEDDAPDEAAYWTIAPGGTCTLRGERIAHPSLQDCAAAGVTPEGEGVQVHELLRVLAHRHPEAVMATEEERRRHVPGDMELFLRLDAWRHPDMAEDELPSERPGFRQMAEALAAGDPSLYRAPGPPNTHWLNWPEAGRL